MVGREELVGKEEEEAKDEGGQRGTDVAAVKIGMAAMTEYM